MELPITRLTLYKHGVGFFERRGKLETDRAELSFRGQEMNDVLKSLTVIDRSGGQVLGLQYPTPDDQEERLAGCSVKLGDDRSLRDLLTSLRGRRVRLVLDQQEESTGTLLGLDEVPERQLLATSLVSLLQDERNEVKTVGLGRVQGVEILDSRGASDLRFFLQASLSQEQTCQMVVHLAPGNHDLSVSYVAPAPTWRVSYRLVAEPSAETGSTALLQGWGIFDNRLEEDLDGISLVLVAGMPLSFVYDLYRPFMPARPVVEEESRVAPGPIEFAEGRARGVAKQSEASRIAMQADRLFAAAQPLPGSIAAISRGAMETAAPALATGEALGELFQYVVNTPVSVQRGHSAMVPIVSATLSYRRDLLYNAAKMPGHPVAVLRLTNSTGLMLERGPVTVIENGEYVGEALLPFTEANGELTVAFAVELGCKVREESGVGREIRGLYIREAYLNIEEWDIRWHEYQLDNRTGQALGVLVEYPRSASYELFDTPEPKERTDQHLRFDVQVAPHAEATFRVQERRLVARREEIRQQTLAALQHYERQGWLDKAAHGRLAELLALWARIAEIDKELADLENERQKIYKAQQQTQGNLSALSTTGKEGALRARYVEQLASSEDQLRALLDREGELKAERERLNTEVEARLKSLG